MKANEVKESNWVACTNWNGLQSSHHLGVYAYEKDVDTFVNETFQAISSQIGISVVELRRANSAFYLAKKKLFANYSFLNMHDPHLTNLEVMLKIPAVSQVAAA